MHAHTYTHTTFRGMMQGTLSHHRASRERGQRADSEGSAAGFESPALVGVTPGGTGLCEGSEHRERVWLRRDVAGVVGVTYLEA